MNKGLIFGAVAVVAVFGGVWWYAGGAGGSAPPAIDAGAAPATTPAAAVQPPPTPVSRTDPTGRPTPTDPRLAALMVTPDNGVIEFVKGADGRVIQEIDQDPNSLGYKQPLRQYVYSGDKVVGVITYRYHPKQVEIVRAAVAYKPDGSIDRYDESTSYQPRP